MTLKQAAIESLWESLNLAICGEIVESCSREGNNAAFENDDPQEI